jgi:hypothetical protein
MSIRLALSVSVAAMALGLPAAAMAVPGDPAIDNPVPGVFRLNPNTLEPACFTQRRLPVDVDTHVLVGPTTITSEIHIAVDDGAPFSIDQVLVASTTDGYKVVNTFDTGTVNNDNDIDPGQTAVGLTSGTAFVDPGDVIICLSEAHTDGSPATENEPYNQEAGGLVSAKNRPILTPHVVGLGESSIDPLNTFKIAFGYDSTPWYTRPAFELGEPGNALFPSVTDPNAIPSPTFDGILPTFVDLFPRSNGAYDAQRVNEVKDARGDFLPFPIPGQGQSFLFRVGGDTTAWIDDGGVPGPGIGLLTVLSRGDFPVSWTLRPSLGAPSTLRSVTFSPADFDAWEQGWQNYYCGKGPHPTLPLAPGTNSPDPRDCPVVINLPETKPVATPTNPTPAQVQVVQAPPVTTNTTTTTTVETPAPAPTITTSKIAKATTCHGSRVIHIVWPKSAKSGTLLFRSKVVKAKLSGGRLRATADLRGMVGTPGAYMKVIQLTTTRSGHHLVATRPFKVC